MGDNDGVVAPATQQKAMLAHIDGMLREAKSRIRGATSHEERQRAMDDYAGAEAMMARVQAWKTS